MRRERDTINRRADPLIESVDQLAKLLGARADSLADLSTSASSLYTTFSIVKSNGKVRTIRAPKARLRSVQRRALDELQHFVRYPYWMMGGVPKRSIITHAARHVGRQMVGTLDIAEFFPSTTEVMVREVAGKLGIVGNAQDVFVSLVVRDDELPQGSPISPFLANLALDSSDRRIDSLCRKYGLCYSRYIDDIAISGDADLRQFHGAIIQTLKSNGYDVATGKVRYMPRSKPQIVTKLVVNDRLRPHRGFVLDVKHAIWSCIHSGALPVALEQSITIRQLQNRLIGRVAHIKSCDAKLGRQLRNRMKDINWTTKVQPVDVAV